MNTTDQRILIQLARRGIATSSETMSSADAIRGWSAIAVAEAEFKAAMEAASTPTKMV